VIFESIKRIYLQCTRLLSSTSRPIYLRTIYQELWNAESTGFVSHAQTVLVLSKMDSCLEQCFFTGVPRNLRIRPVAARPKLPGTTLATTVLCNCSNATVLQYPNHYETYWKLCLSIALTYCFRYRPVFFNRVSAEPCCGCHCQGSTNNANICESSL